MSQNIAVLMGGISAEREVSLVSGKACAEALRETGYQATEIEVGRDIGALVAALTPAPAATRLATTLSIAIAEAMTPEWV